VELEGVVKEVDDGLGLGGLGGGGVWLLLSGWARVPGRRRPTALGMVWAG